MLVASPPASRVLRPLPSSLSILRVRGGALHAAGTTAVPAALAAPLASTLGIHVWDDWAGSAFALNGLKCTVGTILFGLTLLVRGTWPLGYTVASTRMLMLSAFLGIIIGDFLWLSALQLLGAQDTILMTALQPVIAWVAGTFVLKQKCESMSKLGVLLLILGVFLAEFRVNGAGSDSTAATTKKKRLIMGYALNLLNLILDTSGAVLTRRYGYGLDTLEINFLRFGFASAAILGIGVGTHAVNWLRARPAPAWAALPDQPGRIWASMMAAAVLVTFLSPALSNFALFCLPLAVWTALSTLGPVYSIPIKWIREGEKTPARGVLGAILAVTGSMVIGLGHRS